MKITILASLVILAFSEDSALDTKILLSIPQGESGKEISSIKLELAKIVASNLQIAKSVKREEKHYKELVAALEKNQVQVKEIPAAPPSTSVSTPTSIPEQTPSVHSERLISDYGTPGASSIHRSFSSPKNAFTSTDRYWASSSFQFPAIIWMKFNNPHRLARIGYRSNFLWNIPKKMIVVGSHDCTNWQSLLTIENTAFRSNKEFRQWNIPEENRVSYRCIGLKWPVKPAGNTLVVVTEIRMWEQIWGRFYHKKTWLIHRSVTNISTIIHDVYYTLMAWRLNLKCSNIFFLIFYQFTIGEIWCPARVRMKQKLGILRMLSISDNNTK